jgi:signal transduction histidine kinase
LTKNQISFNDATTIVDTCPYGILSINADGTVSNANPAFCESTGIPYAEIAGITNHELWGKLLDCFTIDGDLKTYLGGVLTLRSKSSLKVIRLNCRLQKDGNTRQILYLQDITSESEVDRMKSEFLSVAAHELRTPMAIIFGFSELLMTQNFDKKAMLDMVNTIHNQAKNLTHMINELLDLARIESRNGKDLVMNEQTIKGVVLEIENEWGGLGYADRLSINIPDNTPLVVINKEKIKQAIVNVLSNACKFSSPESRVNIDVVYSTKSSENFLGVQVRDHGLGMSKVQLNRLFERFWRADKTGNIAGSGLGLSIVKEIIEIHKGHIEVESKPNEGTTITLWLPVSRGSS